MKKAALVPLRFTDVLQVCHFLPIRAKIFSDCARNKQDPKKRTSKLNYVERVSRGTYREFCLVRHSAEWGKNGNRILGHVSKQDEDPKQAYKQIQHSASRKQSTILQTCYNHTPTNYYAILWSIRSLLGSQSFLKNKEEKRNAQLALFCFVELLDY